MLVLTRRVGEEIVIGGNIHVTVVALEGGKVRLGVTAPRSVAVDRLEVHERRTEFAAAPGACPALSLFSTLKAREPLAVATAEVYP